jgi:hypothetical protein
MFFLLVIIPAAADSLNNYQMIGSHNSYKKPLPAEVTAYLKKTSPSLLAKLSYSHPSLIEQLDAGLRQLEIDVVNDPQGQQYDRPELETLLHGNWFSKEQRASLSRPGFKVMHIPHVDAMSHCLTFTGCAEQLIAWSHQNPKHLPNTVLVNAKESQPNFLTHTPPLMFEDADYALLDSEIKAIFGNKLITPDSVKGDYATLRNAIVESGWPALKTLRGKFLFIFDANPQQREKYIHGHPSLEGRSMFVSVPQQWDEAAIFIRNNPVESYQEIRSLVHAGFLVRTRADANLKESSEQMALRREAAYTSGAHFISSDFYLGAPLAKQRGYAVSFKKQSFVRTNPIQHNNFAY